jgi:hypothetical protein
MSIYTEPDMFLTNILLWIFLMFGFGITFYALAELKKVGKKQC